MPPEPNTTTININTEGECSRCGGKGITDSGLCLSCIGDNLRGETVMQVAKFQRCPQLVNTMARILMRQYESHTPLIEAEVKIDFLFAFADRDEDTNQKKGPAINKGGIAALGVARAIPTKDRALGRADAEIMLDGDWWNENSEARRMALLDHELHHLMIKIDKRGLVRDDLGRPKIFLRKHDYEFGWFRVIALRHQEASMEQEQAALMLEESGQFFWPTLDAVAKTVALRLGKT